MKDTKRRMMTFTFYDRTGIERDLEEQAAKGWMLEKCAATGWIYRRIEPAKIHFAVTYFPGADAYDPAPSEKQLRFQEFCQHTGWELVASNVQLQIFCNRAENPIPIETDPVIEVENIHGAMKKNMGWTWISGTLLSIAQLALLCVQFINDPVERLASNLFFSFIFMWTMLLISNVSQLFIYYTWLRKARREAQDGHFTPTKGTNRFQSVMLVLSTIGLILMILSYPGSSLRWGVIFCIILITALMAFIIWLSNQLKKDGVSAKANRTATTTIMIVATLGIAFMIAAFVIFLPDGWETMEPYTVNGRTSYIYHHDIPLRIEDLMDTDYAHYSCEIISKDASPLLSRIRAEQSPMLDAPEEPGLSYTIVEVKMASLYDWTVEQMIEDIRRDYRFYSSVDPAPWGAEQVYQLLVNDEVRDRYLLCYENRIVEIELSWTPTAEQMTTVGQILGNP